jgi:hypothetical protein
METHRSRQSTSPTGGGTRRFVRSLLPRPARDISSRMSRSEKCVDIGCDSPGPCPRCPRHRSRGLRPIARERDFCQRRRACRRGGYCPQNTTLPQNDVRHKNYNFKSNNFNSSRHSISPCAPVLSSALARTHQNMYLSFLSPKQANTLVSSPPPPQP